MLVRSLSFTLLLLASGCLDAPASSTKPMSLILQCLDGCRHLVDASPLDSFEPSIAVNPLDDDNIVIADSPFGADALGVGNKYGVTYSSFDGGATWETNRLPGGPGSPPDHPLALANGMADNVLAFLPDGTLLHALLFTTATPQPPTDDFLAGVPPPPSSTGYSLAVLRSTDGGRTYPAEGIRVIAGSTSIFPTSLSPATIRSTNLTSPCRTRDSPS